MGSADRGQMKQRCLIPGSVGGEAGPSQGEVEEPMGGRGRSRHLKVLVSATF